jgi:integrase
MPRLRLTDRTIRSLKPAEEGQVDYFDDVTRGFGVRVTRKGEKSFFTMYRFDGRLRRHTVGRYPDLSLAEARSKAKDVFHAVAHGRDPGAEKHAQRRAETFDQLAEVYLERHAKRRKKSWKEDERILNYDLLPAWRGRKAKSINRRDVHILLEGIAGVRGSPIMANRTLALARKIFNFGIEHEIVETNPCYKIRQPAPERERDRVLGHDELRSVWDSLGTLPRWCQVVFKLYLLTGQRSDEVLGMGRPELDLDAGWWTIPSDRTKNGFANRVPLSGPAVELLNDFLRSSPASSWVFPGPRRDAPRTTLQKPMRLVRKAAGVHFRIHDLRRTAASHMTSIGISRNIVARVLNHLETDVTRIYDRYSYDSEKRDALGRWATELMRIVGEPAPTAAVETAGNSEYEAASAGYLH